MNCTDIVLARFCFGIFSINNVLLPCATLFRPVYVIFTAMVEEEGMPLA